MKLLVATNNAHKLQELREIITAFPVVSPGDLGISAEVEETGTSFLENALLKARTVREIAFAAGSDSEELIVIADDSGVCVDALDGGPGIYSARFGSEGGANLDAAVRNRLLLNKLQGVTDRSAQFVCCMIALFGKNKMIVAQESWPGTITLDEGAGTGGFGYDPVFLLPDRGCTAAELSQEDKNRLSHRGRATRVLVDALQSALRLPK